MQAPPKPENEAERLQALQALALLDTDAEARFDRLTALAAQLFDVPIALVSLVDAERQWFKSRHGLSACETSRDISFCGHAVLGDAVLVVNDAARDARFADNPLVTGAPHIRFYAGRPLKSGPGHRVGTLCIIDSKPRELSAAQLQILDALADMVEREFTLTGIEYARKELIETTLKWSKTQQALHEAQRWNQAIIDHAAYAIISTDVHGLINVFNPGAERLLGYRVEEMAGKLTPAVFHDPHEVACRAAALTRELGRPVEPGFDAFVAKARLLAVADENEWTYIRKNGTRVPVRLSVTALRDEAGAVTGYVGVAQDIGEQKAAQAALQQFKNTLDRTRDCVFMFEPDTLRFFYVNQGAVAQVGYSEDELLRMHPYDIKPTLPESRFREYIAPLLRGERETLTFETVHRHRSGEDMPVEIVLQYIAPAGENPRFVAVVRDMAERREVDRLKHEFVSTVSHELRTPLTAIRGALGLLGGGVAGALPATMVDLVRIAAQNTDRLLALINDILDIEKIEQGKLDFDLRVQGVSDIVEQALAANTAYARQYEVTYRVQGELSGASVRVDGNRMQQVMANLLSNAAKFSPHGGEVAVAARDEGGRVRISVSDHGPGIPENFRQKIFERFVQADGSDTRQKGGTGLGLAISRQIVEMMGGRIWFETEIARGTTFFVEFPLAAPTPQAPDAAHAEAE